ncbi:MAG: hypothetical protein AAB486_00400 [Patescibacteria group bacterium]
MEDFLSALKKYAPVTVLVLFLAVQSVVIIFLYFDLRDLKSISDQTLSNPLPVYSIPTPSPAGGRGIGDQSITDKLFFSNPTATASGTTAAANCSNTCPAGPIGPQGEKGEKGDPGESGTGTTTDGRWVVFCQSRLGPVRQKPTYGCDTGNSNADYKESDLQLWVR